METEQEMRDRIARNLEVVRARIARATERAGRAPDTVRLVAVTKTVGIAEARILAELGVTDLGENRVEDARGKIETLDRPACWHMIGSVQRRKARDVAALFHRVDSVDRLELAEALDRRAAELGKVLPVLIEVNVSGEASKHGIGDFEASLTRMQEMSNLRVEGLMTMAPLVEDPEAVRPVFARLRQLAGHAGLAELSMGMSNDFEVAIEEGATQVRIGTALFA
jgi:pyridoxal phosphate enzyme (YggS family)